MLPERRRQPVPGGLGSGSSPWLCGSGRQVRAAIRGLLKRGAGLGGGGSRRGPAFRNKEPGDPPARAKGRHLGFRGRGGASRAHRELVRKGFSGGVGCVEAASGRTEGKQMAERERAPDLGAERDMDAG